MNMTMNTGARVRRSLLATPGNVEKKIRKSAKLPVDVLMLDLEDGVPNTDDAKAQARQLLGDVIRSEKFACREVSVRINGPRSPWFTQDVAFVSKLGIPTAVVPMVEDEDDIVLMERTFAQQGALDELGVILLIETPAAVLNLPAMVRCSDRINGMIAGGLDYAMCMNSLSILPLDGLIGEHRHDDDLLYLRHRVLAVARAYGLSALDALRPGKIDEPDSARADIEYARWLGFDGVDFYHPAFIELANEVFTPNTDEIAWANNVLEISASRDGSSPASQMVNGRVILPQHIEIAKRLKGQVAAIGA